MKEMRSFRRWPRHGDRYRHGGRRSERPPKLYRFIASAGLLDQNVAARMSGGQMCDETIRAYGYITRRTGAILAKRARDIKRHASEACDGFMRLAESFLGWLFNE